METQNNTHVQYSPRVTSHHASFANTIFVCKYSLLVSDSFIMSWKGTMVLYVLESTHNLLLALICESVH